MSFSKIFYTLTLSLLISLPFASKAASNPIVKKDTAAAQPHAKTEFVSGWNEAEKMAKEQKKPIFTFVWSDNCLESIRMLEDIFTDEDVAEFYNQNFICYKMDANEMANNVRVSNWGVKGLPTMIFMTPKRKIVLMKKGYMKNEELIRTGKIGLKKV